MLLLLFLEAGTWHLRSKRCYICARVTKQKLNAELNMPCYSQPYSDNRYTISIKQIDDEIELLYLVLLSSINSIIKLAIYPWTAGPVPHKHYLVLLGSFYGCSHKQTKSIAANFSHQAAPFWKGEKIKLRASSSKQTRSHILAYIVKLLRRFWFN